MLQQQVTDRQGLDELSFQYKHIFERLMTETEIKTNVTSRSNKTIRMSVIKIVLDVNQKFIFCLLANGLLTSCRITCYKSLDYEQLWSHRIGDKNGHVVLNELV